MDLAFDDCLVVADMVSDLTQDRLLQARLQLHDLFDQGKSFRLFVIGFCIHPIGHTEHEVQ